jgi:hypothetical protein
MFFWGSITYLLTYSLTHSLTHSLTPWCRVLLEKLIVTQLVKKYPAFLGIYYHTKFQNLPLSGASVTLPQLPSCQVGITNGGY